MVGNLTEYIKQKIATAWLHIQHHVIYQMKEDVLGNNKESVVAFFNFDLCFEIWGKM